MKILTIVGARPQFIKASTISRAIDFWNGAEEDSGKFEEIILHTGQHYDDDMSEVFFRDLGLPRPHHELDVGSGPHGAQTGRMLEGIDDIISQTSPDCVLVYGDTNSTLAGALSASKQHIPIAHVEAGLRSFNRKMPEETNRVLTDQVSRWLFCPTETAVENLAKEGIEDGVHLVGDVMYDGMLYYRDKVMNNTLDRLGLSARQYMLATIHRAENTDDPERLKRALEVLNDAAGTGKPVLLVLHPRTRKAIAVNNMVLSESVAVVSPLPYLEMIELLANAFAVLTDSGGLQKEAFFLEVPCLTLRDETEWVETIACGANRLLSKDQHAARDALAELETGAWSPDFSARPYGEGKAAEAILSRLANEI